MKNNHLLVTVVSGVATLLGAGLAAAQDDLYVSNNSNNTIAIIGQGGATTTISSPLLNGPTGLAFNNQGDLFIANNGGSIVEYNTATDSFSTFATGLSNPRGLAFDSDGNLYVANQSSGSITEFADGTDTPTTFVTGLNTPNGIAIDTEGDLYVGLGGSADAIARITPGGVVTDFDTTGVGINNPNGLEFGPNGDLYVVNRNDPSIEQITTNLNGSYFVPNPPADGLNSPKDLAFAPNGDMYVTDYGNNTVTEYNTSGQLIDTFSTDLNGPCFLAFGPAAELAVPEPGVYGMLFGGLGVLYFFHRRRTLLAKV